MKQRYKVWFVTEPNALVVEVNENPFINDGVLIIGRFHIPLRGILYWEEI